MPKTETEKPDIAAHYDTYRQNVNRAMLDVLAEQLGVSADSLECLGVGYDFIKQSWIFPERNETGRITGLLRRTLDGKKFTVTGSKRSLSYIYNPAAVAGTKAYQPGRHNWIRASESYPCPLCEKHDWCLLSSEDPDNPPAVICARTTGGVQQRECGWLHILRPEGDKRQSTSSVLLDTDAPILLVEGASDVCAAFDIGFVAIGRPNDQGGLQMIQKMPLANRAIIVVGENDAGAGERGMEAAFAAALKVSGNVTKLMPPQGVKDLREWVSRGLTGEELLKAAEEGGDQQSNGCVFQDESPSTVAERWLHDQYTVDGMPSLRKHHGVWVEYQDGTYCAVDDSVLRGRLYEYLRDKYYRKESTSGDVKVVPYRSSRAKVNDIFDALNQWCPVTQDPPAWIAGEPLCAPEDSVAFGNGLLDVEAYCRGEIVVHPPTPRYFNMCHLGYNFHDDACPQWMAFLHQITNDDQQVIDLLQEWFGYQLVPDMSHEKLLMIIGRPRSGKGTILTTLQAVLGNEHCAVTTLATLAQSFGLQPLIGKLSAVIGDARTPDHHSTSTGLEKILQITGRDPVTINRKHLPELPMVHLRTRFTIAGNEIPNLTDHARALEARTIIIDLPNSYVGQEDPGLKARLTAEARTGSITAWALKGLKRLRESGRFTQPESSRTMEDTFRAIVSPITQFTDDYCEVICERTSQYNHKSTTVSKDLLYEAYRVWNEQRGSNRTMLKNTFCQNLNREYPHMKTMQLMENGARYRAFTGIRLNQFAYTELLNLPVPKGLRDEEI